MCVSPRERKSTKVVSVRLHASCLSSLLQCSSVYMNDANKRFDDKALI